jgi:hypothetical protein
LVEGLQAALDDGVEGRHVLVVGEGVVRRIGAQQTDDMGEHTQRLPNIVREGRTVTRRREGEGGVAPEQNQGGGGRGVIRKRL